MNSYSAMRGTQTNEPSHNAFPVLCGHTHALWSVYRWIRWGERERHGKTIKSWETQSKQNHACASLHVSGSEKVSTWPIDLVSRGICPETIQNTLSAITPRDQSLYPNLVSVTVCVWWIWKYTQTDMTSHGTSNNLASYLFSSADKAAK